MENESTESTLSPEQVEECRQMLRDSMTELVELFTIELEHLAVVWELAPMFGEDFWEMFHRCRSESMRRFNAGRR